MLTKPFSRIVTLLCTGIVLAMLSAGCGGEPLGDYGERVGEINRETAESMAEAAHILGENGHQAQGGAEHGSEPLEELVEELRGAALELSRVKVPPGMEAFQEDMLAMYEGTVSALESLISLLYPDAGEETGGHGEEAAEVHGEEGESAVGEGTHEGESAHDEEGEPKESPSSEHGQETSEQPHTGTGH